MLDSGGCRSQELKPYARKEMGSNLTSATFECWNLGEVIYKHLGC